MPQDFRKIETFLVPRIFISHAHEDIDFVKYLIERLAKERIAIWWYEWEIGIGDSLLDKIQEGISRSSNLIVVLSQASVNSAWVKEEMNMALISQLEQEEVFVLPILKEDCEIPLILRNRLYADFRKDIESGFQRLLGSIKRPNIGQQSRTDSGEYHFDYKFEYGQLGGLFGIRANIFYHSPRLPYSVQCYSTITTNRKYSRRLQQMEEAGLRWAAYEMLLEAAKDAAAVVSDPILIEGDKTANIAFETRDPERDFRTYIDFQANRLGADPNEDLLFDWKSALIGCIETHREKLKQVLTKEETDNFYLWLKNNPI